MLNVEKVFQQGSCFQHALLGLKALKLNIQVREAFACGHTKRHFFCVKRLIQASTVLLLIQTSSSWSFAELQLFLLNKFKKLEYYRRKIIKTLVQVLGLYAFPIFKYLSKYFAQIYKAQYGAAMLVYLQGHQHGGRKIVIIM